MLNILRINDVCLKKFSKIIFTFLSMTRFDFSNKKWIIVFVKTTNFYSSSAQYGNHHPLTVINHLNMASRNWDVLEV